MKIYIKQTRDGEWAYIQEWAGGTKFIQTGELYTDIRLSLISDRHFFFEYGDAVNKRRQNEQLRSVMGHLAVTQYALQQRIIFEKVLWL